MHNNGIRVTFSSVLLAVCMGPLASKAVLADGKSIVGAWLVQTTYLELDVAVTAVAAFNKDKTFSITNQNGGTGYGIWRKNGNQQYQTKLVGIVEPDDPNGFPVGTIVTFIGEGEYDKNTDTITGSGGTVTWTYGENNDVLYQTTSASVFTRITFDD